jgi:hypothetical protein
MPVELVTADERLADVNNKTSLAIFGRQKIGKTSLIKTCDPTKTLFCNLEAGMKSLQDYRGPSITLRTYTDAKDIACLIGGVDPAAHPGKQTKDGKGWEIEPQAYSQTHFNYVCGIYAETRLGQWWKSQAGKRPLVFWDSISDLTRLGMTWADTQPEAFSDRSGKKNLLGQYGLLGRDIIRMLKHIQHAPGVDVVFIGGLEADTNEAGATTYAMQAEGRKIANELPYIVDQIVTFSDFDMIQGQFVHNLGKGQHRAFCCTSPNPWGLPAGDRSGALDMIEEPNLGKLMAKINSVAERTLASLKT